MRFRSPLRSLVAVLGVAAILAAGCGGGDDTTEPSQGVSGTDTVQATGGDASTTQATGSGTDTAQATESEPVSDSSLLAAMDPVPVDELPAIDVDLGNGQVVHYDAGEEFRVVFFNFGVGYAFMDAMLRGAQEEADRLGIQLDNADAQVDPNRMVQQMQDAIQSGKYGGAFVTPIVEAVICDLSTTQLPAAGIPVVVTNSPLCGRREKDGEEAAAPGTLAFVGGTQFLSTFVDWAEHIREENPGPQKVIVLTGPEQNSQSENQKTAFAQVSAQHPEFEIVADVHTNFSAQLGLQAMQDALQAHPDATIVASIYSELTKSTVNALEQAGRKSQVKIYDIGADSSVVPLIESGDVDDTYPYYPQSIGRTAIRALYAARLGMDIPRAFENDGHKVESLRPAGAPMLFVGQENLQEWLDSGLSEY